MWCKSVWLTNRCFCCERKQLVGTVRESSFSNWEEKECIVRPGTLLECNESWEKFQLSQSKQLKLKSCEESKSIIVLCMVDDVAPLDYDSFLLLLPILSHRERLHIFHDRHLLNYGKVIQRNETVFVRLKDAQTEIEGVIRYKGEPDAGKGIYFGVELMENRGFCSGVYNNNRYFQTAPYHAVFVPLHRLRKNRLDWQKNDRLWAGERIEEKSSGASAEQQMKAYGDLKLNDRIVWPTDSGCERGTVRWIGQLPGDSSGDITIGVEFDNPVGTGTGKYKEQRLFHAKLGHASLVPPLGLMTEKEYENSFQNDPIFQQTNRSLQHGNEASAYQKYVNKSSLPAKFNHNAGFLEPVGAGAAAPMNGDRHLPQYETVNVNQYGSRKPSALPNQSHDPSLKLGSRVKISLKTPLYGIIRWIGNTDTSDSRLTAGVELDEENSIGTDGKFKYVQLFECKPRRALFIPLNKCVRDKRFLSTEGATSAGSGSIPSPDVKGDIPVPEHPNKMEILRVVCGKNRGIQGHHNSCYLDSTLFSMFYFSTVFDSIFNRPKRENDLPEYTEVQKVLKEGIVNPLRKHNYVSSHNVWKLRTLLDKLGTVPGMLGEEKDVEEFLSALLSEIMKADPLLHLSTGEHAYFYQLFMEKDKNLLLPTTQKLVELSFLQGNVKLKKVPACLMVQMPRFGKDYKMFRRIVPSLQLDITDILENSPRDCIVCGDLATMECKQCYQVHGHGLNTTAFCDKCAEKSHQHNSRKGHKPEPIFTHMYLQHFQDVKKCEREQYMKENGGKDIDLSDIKVRLPREKMELFAVICIQTSHYVSFVKCGPGIDAPWVFFDSMADRIGEQGGYNIPEVVPVPKMASWLSEDNFTQLLNQDEDKDLPEHLRRLLCDGYMCMYQSPDVMMFQ